MEYALQSIFYFFRAILNLTLQMQVTDNVTIGGILFSLLLLSSLFYYLGITKNGQ